MTTITISENLIKEKDLILIPRKKYEELLHIADKKKQTCAQFDKDLDEAITEYRAGKYFGPFNTIKDGMKFLKMQKIQKMKK
ncbi:hypothetical protein KKA09_03615 [Patescibacteria group bacterium]|nr:hypothetical protein [Patescibacteria group bacterium]